jgi:hypothetical protein
MIKEFVDRFMEKKPELQEVFAAEHPENYEAVIKAVVSTLNNGEDYGSIDPNRIHEIDDGEYQGTLVYVIGATGYQPSDYWYVKVGYGSCSGCDTLEAIRDYSSDKPTEEQVRDYMTLALHVVQGLKRMGDDEVA